MWASMGLASCTYLPHSGLHPGLPVEAGRGQLQWQSALQASFWQAIARLCPESVVDQLLLFVRLGCMRL